ncbi:hypothetical protein PoB_004811700 [Plakobranchus ocellatus]|uniref:Uncharacterized protein n=1 Tax=Plakobranchus ocellatus TaxID=259542 RepID=A0AAV4BQJ7_9GAST|nr:hypothetical protein PoB_004811700 [Plakobranchus ocellatus]
MGLSFRLSYLYQARSYWWASVSGFQTSVRLGRHRWATVSGFQTSVRIGRHCWASVSDFQTSVRLGRHPWALVSGFQTSIRLGRHRWASVSGFQTTIRLGLLQEANLEKSLIKAEVTGKFERKRSRGRQRELIIDGLATWLGPGKVSDILAAVKDRDLWRDMIANAYKQGT